MIEGAKKQVGVTVSYAPAYRLIAYPNGDVPHETGVCPMAVAIIGGLIVSTTLSLLVVPAFFVVADTLKTRLAALTHREREEEAEEATAH